MLDLIIYPFEKEDLLAKAEFLHGCRTAPGLISAGMTAGFTAGLAVVAVWAWVLLGARLATAGLKNPLHPANSHKAIVDFRFKPLHIVVLSFQRWTKAILYRSGALYYKSTPNQNQV
jgi:hypothetical protein